MKIWDNRQRNYYKSQASKRLAVIYRHAYEELENELYLDVYRICHNAGINLRWMLNDQEWSVWRAQRIWGAGLHCYPEFIINNDVVDFADPTAKIVIEVDSKLHDSAKDEAKDQRLAKLGYQVFRIDGRYTRQDIEHVQNIIQELGDRGRESERLQKMIDLEHNDERVIQRIRNELLRQRKSETPSSAEGEMRLITHAEVVNSASFKPYQKYSELTDDLKAEIESISLYKPDNNEEL